VVGHRRAGPVGGVFHGGRERRPGPSTLRMKVRYQLIERPAAHDPARCPRRRPKRAVRPMRFPFSSSKRRTNTA
jgi:hypothetical protein